jgi:thiol-disulfide isomerase/thioredoxin
MALTPSNMLELGVEAPYFSLQDVVTDQTVALSDFSNSDALVVMFICNHCPYVIHINPALAALANDYKDKHVGFVAISSNDVIKYPQDGPMEMKTHALREGYPFPYLYDESQSVAKAYDAACTPDFYVFDKNRKLQYRGRLCASKPNSDVPVTGRDVREALDALLSAGQVNLVQYPSMGCNIKWK